MRPSSILTMSVLVALSTASVAGAQTSTGAPPNSAMPSAATPATGSPLSPDGQQALTSATKTYFQALHQLGPKKLEAFEAIIAPNYHLVWPNGDSWDQNRVIQWGTTNNINSSGLVESINVRSSSISGNTVTATVDASGSVNEIGSNEQQYRSGSSTHQMTWTQTGGKWQLVEDRIVRSVQTPNTTNNT